MQFTSTYSNSANGNNAHHEEHESKEEDGSLNQDVEEAHELNRAACRDTGDEARHPAVNTAVLEESTLLLKVVNVLEVGVVLGAGHVVGFGTRRTRVSVEGS